MISNKTAEVALTAVKAQIDGGFLYLFAGPVPADADDALDMASQHTQVVRLTNNNDGSTGLTFDAPVGAGMAKSAAETWLGTVAFDGAESASSALAPTFYRFCAAGDDGRSAGSTARLQGTVGGPASTASIVLSSDTVTANGTNTQGVGIFNVTMEAVG